MTSTNSTRSVMPPAKLAHVVLRTNNYSKMVKFYKAFLGANAAMENEQMAFLRYDDEHHRIALINMPEIGNKVPGSSGLEHIAFTWNSLKDLCAAYKQRKAVGIEPGWCVNHGPTTSMYYQDPDGNTLETQVDNFDDMDECNRFVEGEAFAENPLGVDFDPEELCKLVESGEDEGQLKIRKDVGPRGTSADFAEVIGKMGTAKAGAF